MWRLIAWSAFLSFGVLHLLVGALVLLVLIRHHIVECDEILALATEDLVHEYEKFRGEPSLIQQEMDSDVESHGTDNLFLLISSPSGHVVASASASKSILRKMVAAAKDGAQGTYRFNRGRRNDLGRAISIRAKKTALYDGNVLSVGYNVTDAEYNLIHVAMLLGAAMLMTLFVGAWLGAALARRFTAPLRNLAAAAERIADGDYTARVPVSAAGREITQVEDAFNRMGDKNEKAMSDLRALTDDIAHDLRTPLTRLKAAAEVAALESAELNRPLPETVTDEVSAMLEMINTMLEISQTENRIDWTPKEDVELLSFVTRAVHGEAAAAARQSAGQCHEIHAEGRQGDCVALVRSRRAHSVQHRPRNCAGRPSACVQAVLARREEPFSARKRPWACPCEGHRHVIRGHCVLHLHPWKMDNLPHCIPSSDQVTRRYNLAKSMYTIR